MMTASSKNIGIVSIFSFGVSLLKNSEHVGCNSFLLKNFYFGICFIYLDGGDR